MHLLLAFDMSGVLAGAIIGAVVGGGVGLVIALVRLLAGPKRCPDCGEPMQRSKRRKRRWICRACDAESGHHGPKAKSRRRR
ncbi:MAG TPA: hypothetical protein VFA18_04920 [Gemmataceae bacterium]|nr:hypothetical protein [Gemmataceae bacterium]